MKDNIIVSALPTWKLDCSKVLVRADLNVPLHNGTITNDYRLQAFKPTLDCILNKNGIPIIITHIGRPKNNEPHLSTKHLLPWFTKHGYTVHYAESIETIPTIQTAPSECILVENLRFFKGEKEQSIEFAQQIASCAPFFVQDAFATLHRKDSSITLLAQQFDRNHKTIGLCVQRELTALNQLRNNPQRPYIAILGGGKVHDKLPLLEKMLSKIDIIMLCPATVFTFLKSQGKEVGKSLIDHKGIELCKTFLNTAQKNNVPILFPSDYYVADDSIDGKIHSVLAHEIPSNAIGISVGPQTVADWKPYLQQAQSIFYNSGMGFLSRPETLKGAHLLLDVLATCNAFTVIGGGESVATVQAFDLTNAFDFLSTGGGATLAYLAGEYLPGLYAITD